MEKVTPKGRSTPGTLRGAIQIGRSLIVSDEFAEWFISSGFEKSRLEKLHVTLAYSRQPVSWGSSVFHAKAHELSLPERQRSCRVFDGNLVVLVLESIELSSRWEELLQAGASWDFPDFVPHLTLGREEGLVVDEIQAFSGRLDLTGEYRKAAK